MTQKSHSSELEQRSAAWYEARNGLITASSAGAILGLNPYRTADDVLRQMVRDYHGLDKEFTGNQATEYGTFHEDAALFDYQMTTGNKVEKCGFFKAGSPPWIGASPDGLIGDDGLIEIKCPFRMRDGKGEFKSIYDQLHYHAQVMVQLYVTGRKWCDFYQWAPDGRYKLERVEFTPDWLSKIDQLKRFYGVFLEEINNPAHLEPLRKEINNSSAQLLLREYDEVCDQIEFAQTRKKEILDLLVSMAKGRDALICGRKLTKVERQGSISYATVVKKHCPDVDLEQYRGKPSESWRLT